MKNHIKRPTLLTEEVAVTKSRRCQSGQELGSLQIVFNETNSISLPLWGPLWGFQSSASSHRGRGRHQCPQTGRSDSCDTMCATICFYDDFIESSTGCGPLGATVPVHYVYASVRMYCTSYVQRHKNKARTASELRKFG